MYTYGNSRITSSTKLPIPVYRYTQNPILYHGIEWKYQQMVLMVLFPLSSFYHLNFFFDKSEFKMSLYLHNIDFDFSESYLNQFSDSASFTSCYYKLIWFIML